MQFLFKFSIGTTKYIYKVFFHVLLYGYENSINLVAKDIVEYILHLKTYSRAHTIRIA